MLSEYYIYLFMLYETAILYSLCCSRKRHCHVLLWLPLLTVGTIALAEPLLAHLVNGGHFPEVDHPVYVIKEMLSQWNKHIEISLAVCLLISIAAWGICKMKKTEKGLALPVIFICGIAVCSAAGYFNLPYAALSSGDSTSWQREENGVPYYDYGAYVSIPVYDAYIGQTNAELLVYALPTDDAEVLYTIEKDRDVYLTDLDFSAPTNADGWRYAFFDGEGNFADLEDVRGYIKVSNMLDAFSRGQKKWHYNAIARKVMFSSDRLAWEKGLYVSPDLSKMNVPMGEYTSIVLLMIWTVGFVCKKTLGKKDKRVGQSKT